MTVEEGLKMVVSGGIVTPPDRGAGPDDAAQRPNAKTKGGAAGEAGGDGGPVVEPAVSRSAET